MSAALLSAEIVELQPQWTVLVEDLDPYRHLTERWPGDTLSLHLVGPRQGEGHHPHHRHGPGRLARVSGGARASRLCRRAGTTGAHVRASASSFWLVGL